MIAVAVIIPFYQRAPGLLTAAVRSILAQQVPPDVAIAIHVVDDASPLAAADELAAIAIPAPHTLTITRQDNAGPGAARNRGLDAASAAGVDFIAFLDSDDRWRPTHLADALATLGDDADLFFDDHLRVQYPDASYMQTNRRLARWIDAGVVRPLDAEHYAIRANDVLRPFLEDCLAQTSTLVCRAGVLSDVRFDPTLRTLGEDLLVMLQVASRARAVRFSARVGVDCDEGISMYHSALSWNHPDAPMRFAASLLFWTRVRDRVALGADGRAYVEAKIAGVRRGFAFIWSRHLLRNRSGHRASLALLKTQLRWGPRQMLPALAAALARKVGRVPMFPEH